MKRIISLFLTVLLLFSLSSCGKDGQELPDDSMLTDRARALIPLSVEMDALFFVEGIPTAEDGHTEGIYKAADMTQMSARGYGSLAVLREHMAQIYTPAVIEIFFSLAIDAFSNGTVMIQSAYCYDTTVDGTTVIMVSGEGIHSLMARTEYDLSTLTVTEKTATSARLSLSVRVISAEEPTQSRTETGTLTLTKVGDVWLLDSLTCIKF